MQRKLCGPWRNLGEGATLRWTSSVSDGSYKLEKPAPAAATPHAWAGPGPHGAKSVILRLRLVERVPRRKPQIDLPAEGSARRKGVNMDADPYCALRHVAAATPRGLVRSRRRTRHRDGLMGALGTRRDASAREKSARQGKLHPIQ